MTMDPFTEYEEAAEDAADLWTRRQGYATTGIEWVAFGQGHLAGSAWARDHLAAQEPTSTGAGARAVRALHTGTRWPGVTDKPICDECDRPWPCLTIRALDGDA